MIEELRARLVAAVREEASHHPGDDECEDRCVQDEDVCMAAHIHTAWGQGNVIQAVYASPDRIAAVACEVLADVLLDEADAIETQHSGEPGEAQRRTLVKHLQFLAETVRPTDGG